MYGNSLETKFNEINSYSIFKKQIKQQILLYAIDNYHKYYIYIYIYIYIVYLTMFYRMSLVIYSI